MTPADALVQGVATTSAAPRPRLSASVPVVLLVSGFLVSSLTVFALAYLLGGALRVEAVDADVRAAVAGVLCLLLLGSDVRVLRGRRPWAPGPSRQTPKAYSVRGIRSAALLWGLDTGLAVTTFRVVTLTWAALAFAALHLGPWWTGLAYGPGFALPLAATILGPRPRPSGGGDGEPLWLPRLLARLRRPVRVGAVLVLVSASLATAAAAVG